MVITGTATNGEVEDYQWNFSPTAVFLESFTVVRSAAPWEFMIFSLLSVVASLLIMDRSRQRRRRDRPGFQPGSQP